MTNAYEEAAPSRADVLNLEFPGELHFSPQGMVEVLKIVRNRTRTIAAKEERLRRHYSGEELLRADQVSETHLDQDRARAGLAYETAILNLLVPDYPWDRIIDHLDEIDIGNPEEDQITQIRQSL